ncbi:hypothetical protein STASHLEY_00540 [Brevundimonas phage vB_BpoS-StAshley]|nr:hypothetical protein STASHLEY_00540 [Brevundimonas phage vB_BpoS-StAshley]
MGKKYIEHSDLCGCNTCAIKADNGDESKTFTVEEDPDYLDCGCSVWSNCDCAAYD